MPSRQRSCVWGGIAMQAAWGPKLSYLLVRWTGVKTLSQLRSMVTSLSGVVAHTDHYRWLHAYELSQKSR